VSLSAEHKNYLEQLGIGVMTPAKPLPTPAELNLTPLYPYQERALEQLWAAIDAGETRIM
jgi:hypothetical protein